MMAAVQRRASPGPSRRSRAGEVPFGLAALILLCGLGVAAGTADAGDPFLRQTATVRVAREVGPAVVSITGSSDTGGNPFGRAIARPQHDRFFDYFDPRRRQRGPNRQLELGSGVIIDARGHVLTNEHVISNASRIRVRLADGRSFETSLVGADPNNDLAVLRIETDEKLPWIEPGHSDDLLVGEPVIAIGNPFGFSNTVTTGVISALDRTFHSPDRSYSFHGFIQTDASINPGNSGGPLLNAEGTLIAINSAVYNGAQGIGFAIPIDVARRVISELIEHGELTPIWLGAEFQNLDPALRQVMKVPGEARGVLVSGVRPKGPADRGGLRRGDVILALDGLDIGNARDLIDYLKTALVDQDLEMDVYRKPNVERLRIRTEAIPAKQIRELAQHLLGLVLEEQPSGPGFAITGVRQGSRAQQIGLHAGDRLLRVNGRELTGDDELRRAIIELRGRDRATVVVQRGSGQYYVTIPLA